MKENPAQVRRQNSGERPAQQDKRRTQPAAPAIPLISPPSDLALIRFGELFETARNLPLGQGICFLESIKDLVYGNPAFEEVVIYIGDIVNAYDCLKETPVFQRYEHLFNE